jgi:hypothetical protein
MQKKFGWRGKKISWAHKYEVAIARKRGTKTEFPAATFLSLLSATLVLL